MIYINDFSEKFEQDLNLICKNSPYGARIISYFNAYYGKQYDFLDFWICSDERKMPCCAFCRYYSTMIICGTCSDLEEMNGFISAIPVSSILCDGELALNFEFLQGETLLCEKLSDFVPNEYSIKKLYSSMSDLKMVYDLLVAENSDTNALPNFESFFLDISHRIRHNTAEVYAVYSEDGRIVSTATVLAKSDDTAVVGCVSTASDQRGKGCATSLVFHLTKSQLEKGRAVYLHREKEISLYERLGYKTVGMWREYLRQHRTKNF